MICIYFVNDYCINVYEATLSDRANYFSKIARFPMTLPAVVFIIILIFQHKYSAGNLKMSML